MPSGAELTSIYASNFLEKDNAYISEIHSISAAVKSRFTTNAFNAASECRTILGGHGYSAFSRIPSLVDDLDVNQTWEGDNQILLQQTSKHLMRIIAKKKPTKIVDLTYIHEMKGVVEEEI